jgi:hypothetical protein
MQSGKGAKAVEICVLHMGWKSDEDKYRQRCYALLEYQQAGKTEYAVRCFTEEDEADTALCWMNPRLAQDFEKAYAVLYHLALRQVSPIHLEDVLGDMEL